MKTAKLISAKLISMTLLAGLLLPVFANASGDLWISTLSLPPDPSYKAFGIYIHCPQGNQVEMDLTEIISLSQKTAIATLQASFSTEGKNLVFLSPPGDGSRLKLAINQTQSIAIAPFDYPASLTLEPALYVLSPHQSSLVALELNPAYPQNDYQPLWGENLQTCPSN